MLDATNIRAYFAGTSIPNKSFITLTPGWRSMVTARNCWQNRPRSKPENLDKSAASFCNQVAPWVLFGSKRANNSTTTGARDTNKRIFVILKISEKL